MHNSLQFILRHHYAPVSDLLVGSRTDPMAISAGSDGTVVAWDFRFLGTNAESEVLGVVDTNARAGQGLDSSHHLGMVRSGYARK